MFIIHYRPCGENKNVWQLLCTVQLYYVLHTCAQGFDAVNQLFKLMHSIGQAAKMFILNAFALAKLLQNKIEFRISPNILKVKVSR